MVVAKRSSLRTVDGGSARGVAPVIALVSCGEAVARWITECVASLGDIVVVSQPSELAGLRSEREVDLVVIESTSADPSAFDSVFEQVGRAIPVLVAVPAGGPEPPPDPRVFYVVRPSLTQDDVGALIRGAIHRATPATAIPSPAHAERLQRILSASARFVSARDLAEAGKVAELSIRGFVTADRVHCLFHDAESGALWSETDEGREGQATMGLAGFVARTGDAVVLERAESDPRFDRALDDPEAEGNTRLMAVPVGDRDGVHAVFIATRSGTAPFSAEERDMMAVFAERAGPLMHHLALLVEAEAIVRSQRERLFRSESLQAHADQGNRGDVVRVSPSWIRWAYWMLVVLMVASVVYIVVGEVDQYSSGPAIVRVHERTELAAQSSGPLLEVYVSPGQRVDAGTPLARLDDGSLRAELRRIQREMDTQLRKRMLDPSDSAATQALISLRGQLRGVMDRLELRQIRAPHAGTVSDLRIRAGQHIEVGDIVMSLVHDDERRRVIALLPGADRPQLHPGMILRLELRGYRYAYQSLVIDEVSNEVIGPAEAQRFLGPQISDSVVIPGPVTVVHASLLEDSFEADGGTFDYHDGMLAEAEVRVRTESILELFFPAIKRLDDDA
ncbi:MAG: biotin/lipoyl-binding protein [Nannocystaceae bacterium]